MIKIEKGRLTRYARKVDVFFSVTAVTCVTQTVNASENGLYNVLKLHNLPKRKKNHSHDPKKRIRSGSFYV